MRLREGEKFLSLRSLLSIDYWLSVGLTWIPSYIRALWNECCDTKTNIITTANQLMSKYYKKPMKVTTSKRLEARKNAACQTYTDFYFNLIGWKLMWHIFLLDQSCTAKKNWEPNSILCRRSSAGSSVQTVSECGSKPHRGFSFSRVDFCILSNC